MTDSSDKHRKKIETAKDKVIGSISETMDLYGVTPAAGNLYATMYFKEQMTLDEMREELQMSKPSMSTSVRKLQEIDMVKKTFTRGSRKHTYIAEKDFFRFFRTFYSEMWDREAKTNMEAVESAQKDLIEVINDEFSSPEIIAESQLYYDQLEESKTYYHWLNDLAKSLRTGEIFDFLPKDK
ncbi:choline uptake/conversion transcriptional regulator CudC [Salisediminibacterium beveridgei]|uniref:HTH-type transcriptional regulator n=1 Tax=Salisediminibacterium beveridgei TaxID=632773 RepID=A0A1D7QZS9_9BACI|nr:GbsR/MarR family transcriptional regulator [Salisediminibacterium beveridgei]AOM84513.1 hypothetical protein BBEV_3198 [Salisediminibacterium beveridgei]